MEQVLQKIAEGEPQLAGKILGEVEGIADPRTWGYEPAQLPGVIRMADPTRVISNWYATPEYRQAVETLYRWRQAGYLPERPLQSAALLAARQQGEYPVHFTVFRPDLEVGIDLAEGHSHLGRAFQPGLLSEVTRHMTGICKYSQHPEQALAFLNLVYTDEAVYNMMAKGIEGIHWSWQDLGQRLITRTNSPNAGKYLLERDWMFGNQFLAYAENPAELGVWQAVKELNEAAKIPVDGAFVFDPTPVQAEMSAIQSVIARYDLPLRWGLNPPDDPRLGIEAFNRDLQAAGMDKVLQEMQKQFEAYLAKNF
jgi:putative aldouronate transport system substrate-binding protein